MGDPRDTARQWLAGRYEAAAELCRLEDCDGNIQPCAGHVTDAILNAPGIFVGSATNLAPEEPFDVRHHVVIWLPAQPIGGDHG